MKLESFDLGRPMTHNPPPPKLSLLPESAPFTPEQRAWLDGFFVAALGLSDSGITALPPQDGAALMAGVGATAEEDDGAPWHDQAMPLADRMKLADGRPLRRRMMAAMGQQDCGQCGYECQGYAEATATQDVDKPKLCIPGGKETLRTLRGLYGEMGAPAAHVPAPTIADAAAIGRSRGNPTEAV